MEPRKRPRQNRSRAAFEAMLEAAARILEAEGLEALTTNRVAERAGVSIGSLYQYFPNKAALLAELTRRERAALLEGLDAVAADTPRGLLALVARLAAVAVAHQLARPALARALDLAEPLLGLDAETAALDAAVAARLAGLLAAAGVADPALAARDVAALGKGMIDAAGRAGETDRAFLAERVARAAMGRLAAPVPVAGVAPPV